MNFFVTSELRDRYVTYGAQKGYEITKHVVSLVLTVGEMLSAAQ
jgi:hypothetical protein